MKHRATQSPSPNLRYVGPVLLRSEANYHVATLPDRAGVVVGSFTDEDCKEFATAVRAETAGPTDAHTVYCQVKDDALKDPAKLRETLNRVKEDASDVVRWAAPKPLFQSCAHQYGALGQYSNAVEILHQAILSDSKADWSYNQLAWIKATCPDGSIRNGHDAISAASQACELTAWKNWMFLDTLAAAYAEDGDFKRAIEFQEQALCTGIQPSQNRRSCERDSRSINSHTLFGKNRMCLETARRA